MNAPTPAGDSVSDSIKPLRPLFVWALLGFAALSLVFTFLDWLIPSNDTLASRSYFADFVDLYTVAFPLVAILIATQIAPALAASKVFALIALAEYAAVLFFGAITFLIGLGYAFTTVDNLNESVGALGHIVFGVFELGIAALSAYAVLRVFTALGGKLPSTATPPVAG
jgi:hypothetical protein